MSDTAALLKLLKEEGIAYMARAHFGPCKRCGFREDLRFGACFCCASGHVDGKGHGDGIHELWDRHNPANRWFVME